MPTGRDRQNGRRGTSRVQEVFNTLVELRLVEELTDTYMDVRVYASAVGTMNRDVVDQSPTGTTAGTFVY